MTRRVMRVVSVAALLAWSVSAVGAQAPRAPREGEVETEPIRCWWKTDRTAIRVGERFGLVLTCAVIETATVTVVPAANQLEPGAVSLTPFEAVSGERQEDVVVPPWRYVQYAYEMRLLSEGFFGQDIDIPGLTVAYTVQQPGLGEGREQTYQLPALPMRVLSLVPRTSSDIRDASGQTFATVESRRFRASAALAGAGIAFVFAAVLAGLALVGAAGRFRARDPRAVRPLPAGVLFGAARKALAGVRAEARGGWTPALVRRALAALRLAGAAALGRPVAQRIGAGSQAERAGQIAAVTGWRRKRAMLSASTAPSALLARAAGGETGAETRAALEALASALTAFTEAGYGRAGTMDAAVLDPALDQALSAVRRLRTHAFWRSLRPRARMPGSSTAAMAGLGGLNPANRQP